jgi:hypothetical protein
MTALFEKLKLPSNLCCSDRGGIFADVAFLATSGDR